MPASIVSVNAKGVSIPGGHYSHINIYGGLAFLSGQLPIDAHGKVLTASSFGDQARQVLANIDACLTTISVPRSRLIQLRAFVTDIALWKEFDAIYSEWIGDHRPSRTVVGVSQLHYGVLIELEATAVVTDATQ